MYTSLEYQGVLEATRVVSGLDQRSSYPVFGPAAEHISFLSHYIYQAPDNEVNQFLIDQLAAQDAVPDLFMPDGFSGAQMIARAVSSRKPRWGATSSNVPRGGRGRAPAPSAAGESGRGRRQRTSGRALVRPDT